MNEHIHNCSKGSISTNQTKREDAAWISRTLDATSPCPWRASSKRSWRASSPLLLHQRRRRSLLWRQQRLGKPPGLQTSRLIPNCLSWLLENENERQESMLAHRIIASGLRLQVMSRKFKGCTYVHVLRAKWRSGLLEIGCGDAAEEKTRKDTCTPACHVLVCSMFTR